MLSSRGSGLPIVGCALVIVTALLGGCTRVITGTTHPVVPGRAAGEAISAPELLIDPQRFPSRYPAAVLDGTAVYRVLQDIDGVAAGSVVTPPQCAPPPLEPHSTAAVQGIDSQDASSLIVAVTRPSPPLQGRAEQLTACGSFTAVRGEDASAVTVTRLPSPPVDADDSYAFEQTVALQSSASVRTSLTFVAQVGDTRVIATWLHDGTPETSPDVAPDTASLDAVFSDSVLKVRRIGGP